MNLSRDTTRYLRAATLVVGAGVLAWSSARAWLLYTDVAPFHQSYEQATHAQSQAVSSRLLAALAAMPLAFMLTLAAILGAAKLARHPRRAALVFASVMLLAGFHSCGVYFSLPYGFGSEYKHASPEQLAHLAFAKKAGLIFLASGLILVALMPPRSKQIASGVGPSTPG